MPEAAPPARPPARALRRLLRSVLSEDFTTIARAPAAGEIERATEVALVRKVLAAELVAGAPASEALVASVRALARRQHIGQARVLVRAARRIEGLDDGVRAAAAVIAVELGRFGDAAEHLSALRREAALSLAPAEVLAVEYAEGGDAAATAAELLSGPRPLHYAAALDVARQAFAHGDLALADRALALVRDAPALPSVAAAETAWLERWGAKARMGGTPPAPSAGVVFAVLDYGLPDYRRASANVGDYVQTLASLGHLVRRDRLRFRGERDLVAELESLQAAVPPEHRLAGEERDVHVLPVNRDASSLDQVPEGTWMLAFGWYMHAWFRVHYDFPFHPNLRPIFLSFHVSRPESLGARGLEYLSEHAPIGCRDWGTARRLLEHGIPAFFSGCLTTTVDLLFPSEAPAPAPGAPVALVEADAPVGASRAVELGHSSLEIRDAALPENLARAARQLESYRRDYSSVVTSRLHCYLPARALGVDVVFRPKRQDDPRFDGLIGIDDAAFAAMQRGIGDRLETVLTHILEGDSEEDVRAAWREACAPDVEEARRRLLA